MVLAFRPRLDRSAMSAQSSRGSLGWIGDDGLPSLRLSVPLIAYLPLHDFGFGSRASASERQVSGLIYVYVREGWRAAAQSFFLMGHGLSSFWVMGSGLDLPPREEECEVSS
jgi:hypothetical protein